jgi:hypothetical protein
LQHLSGYANRSAAARTRTDGTTTSHEPVHQLNRCAPATPYIYYGYIYPPYYLATMHTSTLSSNRVYMVHVVHGQEINSLHVVRRLVHDWYDWCIIGHTYDATLHYASIRAFGGRSCENCREHRAPGIA